MTPARGPLDAARNYFPGVYHRMVEIMQLISSSGMIMIPTEDDRDRVRGRPTSASTSARPAARPTTGCACSAWRGT